MSRLLEALTKVPSKRFQCPRTGLEVEARTPSRKDLREARKAASDAWGERGLRNAVELDEYVNVQREHLLARCIWIDGAPIGMAAVDALDETALGRYDAELKALEEPEVEEWTPDEVSELVEGLKKKDTRIESLLSDCAPARLLALLRIMAAQQSS